MNKFKLFKIRWISICIFINILVVISFNLKSTAAFGIDKNLVQSKYNLSDTLHSNTPKYNCPNTILDERNGKIYRVVEIGDQCWMAENLNIGIRLDSTEIPLNNDIIEKYCYRDLEANCDVFGALYKWDELMEYSAIPGSRGLCMEGWHIPTDEEWKILEGNLDSQFGVGSPEWNALGYRGSDAAYNLKLRYSWYLNGNGEDIYALKIRPHGFLYYAGGYRFMWQRAPIWTSTMITPSNQAYYRNFRYNSSQSYRYPGSKNYAFPVRCVKD